MTSTTIATSIGEGADQEVRKLLENDWTRIIQITLRSGKVLARHIAKEPITIQCVAGEGVLLVGADETISLTPGVIVPLEREVTHAVESAPAVSILVTRFLATP